MRLSVELGPLQDDEAKPVFEACVGDRRFLIELDSSALQKLAGARSVGVWRDLIDGQRGRIRSAAQELYDGGFLSGDATPRLYLTALDII